MWDLPGPGIKPMSSALAGGFLTIAPPGKPRERFSKTGWEMGVVGCVISSWTFWLVGGEIIGSQHHQPSGSKQSGVYMLVGSIQLTSSTWWGFQYLQNSSKDIAQNITYSPWRGTKSPRLCLMLNYYYFVLLDCFPFFLHFLTSLIKFTLGTLGRPRRLKFFYRKEAGRGHGEWCFLFWEGPIGSHLVTLLHVSSFNLHNQGDFIIFSFMDEETKIPRDWITC